MMTSGQPFGAPRNNATPAPAASLSLPAEMLHADPAQWYPRLARLLDEQSTLCAQLDDLSVKQTAVVTAGDTDALLGVLGQRQVVVDRVSEVNQLLEPFRVQKDAILSRLAPPQRDALVQKIGKIAALVESVRARDDMDRARLEKQRTVVADELSAITRGRGAAAAYAGSTPFGGSAKFHDRKG